MSESLTW